MIGVRKSHETRPTMDGLTGCQKYSMKEPDSRKIASKIINMFPSS